MRKQVIFRVILALAACAGLLIFFLRQRFDFAWVLFGVDDRTWNFILNRTIRFFVNDLLAVVLIYALFRERKFVLFALWVQVFGVMFLLIPYFVLKINFPAYNGPLINFLHRIILNPTLILLLIPAFYYQQRGRQRVDVDD